MEVKQYLNGKELTKEKAKILTNHTYTQRQHQQQITQYTQTIMDIKQQPHYWDIYFLGDLWNC